MDDHGGGTYLEDFLLSLEILPNNIRRECELLRTLDKDVSELNREVDTLEREYLENLRKLKTISLCNPEAPGESEINIIKEKSDKLFNHLEALRKRAKLKIIEKKAIAENLILILDQFGNKLDLDLASFEADLREAGEYEPTKGIAPNAEVAFKLSLDMNDKTLILGQVIAYRSEICCYEVMDIDDQKRYTISDTHVLPLGMADSFKRLMKGDCIYALYPDTTIFYLAVVMHGPRKGSGPHGESTVTVQFLGDEDSSGNLPMVSVPLKFIVRAPQFM